MPREKGHKGYWITIIYGHHSKNIMVSERVFLTRPFSYSMLRSHRQHYSSNLIGNLNPKHGWRIPILSKNLSSHRPLNRLSVSLPLLPQDRIETDLCVRRMVRSNLCLPVTTMVEPMGVEPTTSCLQGRCSPN